MANNTVKATANQHAAMVADPRARAAEHAAARLAVGSPPVRTRCSCPAAASAGAAVAASAVAGWLGAAVDYGAVAVAVLGDICLLLRLLLLLCRMLWSSGSCCQTSLTVLWWEVLVWLSCRIS